MAIVQIARNAVLAKLINPDPKIVNRVNTLLSYEVNTGMWTGKSSLYDVTTDTFPAGMAYMIQEELARAGHTVQMIQRPLPFPLGPENPVVDEFEEDPRYDYQMKALRQVEKFGAGIIRVATGGGKSKIAKLIMKRYGRLTLFLTTRGILLYQMKEQVDAMTGEPSGVIGDGEMTFSRGVNMGMVQTLVQALEEPTLDRERRAVVQSIHSTKNGKADMSADEVTRVAEKSYQRKVKRREAILKFLSLVEVVIGEEAHEVGGESYYEILRYCRNAHIRIALTATPFMRDSALDNMRLMAAFGPVLIDVSEQLLIERGILAKPYFRLVDCPAPAKLRKSSPFERAYELGYTTNEGMLAEMLRDAKKAAEHGLPILTLIARKRHGDAVLKHYKEAGLKFVFLKGEDDMAGRRKQLDLLRTGEIHGVIGTNILDVGVDVPAIGLVQLAAGMKAQVALRQRIGRGLRAKKRGPNIAFIADYSCNANLYLSEHARQREAIIRGIPGFAEGVLPAGADFDWSLFRK